MLSPLELKLPDKFTQFRPGQYPAVIDIAVGTKRFSLLSAPTGSGKSLIYIAVAKLLGGGRTLVLTGTKGLQDQLVSDFSSIGLADIRGRANYECKALSVGGELYGMGDPNSSCADGPCKLSIKCSLKDSGCDYFDSVDISNSSKIVVTNYAYWMSLGRYSDPGSLGKFDLLVLDEGHTAADWLSNFCTIKLSKYEIKTLLNLDLPDITKGVPTEWASGAANIARNSYREIRRTVHTKGSAELIRLARLGRDLVDLSKADSSWVCESIYRGVQFCPVWPQKFAEEFLFRGIPKVILSSATVVPATAKYLGIKDYDYVEVPSTFPPKRRPFIYVPTVRVDQNMGRGNKRILLSRIDCAIEDRLDRKGIIHSRSYERTREIVSGSKYSSIMLTHKDSRGLQEIVERFKQSRAPCILVSPSIETGFNFPDDECRYQIIVKVPFISTKSALIKARVKSDKGLIYYLASKSLIQMSGRGMRSSKDWCETLIFDDHWAWFKGKGEFNVWFTEACRWENILPGALKV